MQPTFLPWAGYLRMMSVADRFVFLDDVQLSRQSWQTRNRILVRDHVQWVMVPFRHVGLAQTIAETEIVESARWRRKIGRTLRQCYANHPFAADLNSLISFLEQGTQLHLADVNIALISYCAMQLNIEVRSVRSGGLGLKAIQRSNRLAEACRLLGCDTYLSPGGAADYINKDGLHRFGDIRVEHTAYSPPGYFQKGATTFIPNLSIVDVIANLGWKGTAHYVRAPWNPEPNAKRRLKSPEMKLDMGVRSSARISQAYPK